jgi:hypothetical protein
MIKNLKIKINQENLKSLSTKAQVKTLWGNIKLDGNIECEDGKYFVQCGSLQQTDGTIIGIY